MTFIPADIHAPNSKRLTHRFRYLRCKNRAGGKGRRDKAEHVALYLPIAKVPFEMGDRVILFIGVKEHSGQIMLRRDNPNAKQAAGRKLSRGQAAKNILSQFRVEFPITAQIDKALPGHDGFLELSEIDKTDKIIILRREGIPTLPER